MPPSQPPPPSQDAAASASPPPASPAGASRDEHHHSSSSSHRRHHHHHRRLREAGSPEETDEGDKPHHSAVGVFSKRKGVRYRPDGAVASCRFCEILRRRDEPFLYEDERVVVFRPLRPIVASHILIVPRAHIRNVTMLEHAHEPLLRQMKRVAERVLLSMSPSQASTSSSQSTDTEPPAIAAVVASPCSNDQDPLAASHSEDSERSQQSSKGTDDEDACSPRHSNNSSSSRGRGGGGKSKSPTLKCAFHVPPFNSIDHVHMHAFWDAPRRMGVFGRIKYRTESWWCRSFDDVLARLSDASEQQQHRQGQGRPRSQQCQEPQEDASIRATDSKMERAAGECVGHVRAY